MDESGIIGQIILDNSGTIKSSNGTLQNGEIVQQIKVIVGSTAKLIDKNNNQLNRVTISFQESDIIIYVDQQDIVVLERKRL